MHVKYVKQELDNLTFMSNKSAEILLELCTSSGWQLSSEQSFEQVLQFSSQTLPGRDFSVMTPAQNDVTEDT